MPIILVIDDNESMAELIQDLVELAGYDAEVAYSGLEGLDRAREGMPDLILVDLMMPGLSGWEMYEQLREFSSIPVIFVTAFDNPQNKARAAELGAEGFISKEMITTQLAQQIHLTLESQKRGENIPTTPDQEYLH